MKMDKIKSVRLELEDGNYSDEIPFFQWMLMRLIIMEVI